MHGMALSNVIPGMAARTNLPEAEVTPGALPFRLRAWVTGPVIIGQALSVGP